MWKRIFLEHPNSAGEGYFEHQRVALGYGFALLGAGLAALVHACFPSLFKTTGSRMVARIYRSMEVRNKPHRPSALSTTSLSDGRGAERSMRGAEPSMIAHTTSFAAASSAAMAAAPILPGALFAALLAALAIALGPHLAAPAVLIALVLGVGCAFATASLAPGTAWASRDLTKIAVAMLGARINLGIIQQVGLPVTLLVIAAVGLTLALGFAIARLAGLTPSFAILTAASVAICGASAAAAIAAILPRTSTSEREMAATVGSVTLLGCAAMVAYPLLAVAMGFDQRLTGLFLGATLHELAQAAGASYALSDEAGATAVAAKLIRVATLLPAAMLVGVLWSRSARNNTGPVSMRPPTFLIAFLLLAAASSLGAIPDRVVDGLAALGQFSLVVAMAALGLRLPGSRPFIGSLRPFLVISSQSLLLAAMIAAGLVALT